MANTVLQTRIQLKYDTYTNWQTNNPVLRKGELGIAEVPAETGATQGEPAVLIKVGDGTSNWKDLKYITGLAGDVYAWAKAATKPTYTANEISGLSNYISGQIKDTDTQYTIKLEGRTVKLFSKNKEDADFGETPIASVTIPETTYTLITGVTNGTVKFNGTEVPVAGLKSAAYAEASAFDGAGSAAAVLGEATDAASANTVHGAKAAAAAAQATANAAMPKAGGTFTGAVTLSGAPTANLHAATKKYVDEAKASAVSTAAADATTKANAAKDAAAADATSKANQALTNAKAYADEKTAGLTGAMHYKGAVEAWPPTGAYVSGDVVLYGSKEYVYDGKSWHELGDEGSHVLKTQKVNGHALSGDITLTAADVGAATSADITSAIEALDVAAKGGAGKYIQSIQETNGKISAVEASMPTALKNPNALTFGTKTYDGSAAQTITAADLGAITDISGKQDSLTFDGTYNAATNKAATVSTVTNAINNLNVKDAEVTGEVVSAVSETNGKITVTRRALIEADIPTIGVAKVSGLAKVATSGKIDDLTQTAYIIFDCGSSSTVI